MKKCLSALFVLLLCSIGMQAQVKVDHLLTENRIDPVGIDVKQPRFSWQLSGTGRNIRQTAYEIKLTKEGKQVWSSGKIPRSQSVQVAYAGSPLQPGQAYSWQVRVWDNNTRGSSWSAPASFITSLFDTTAWKARWIEPGYTEAPERPSPLFRKQFSSDKKIRRALAHITAHGMYEATINGKRVGEAYLTPGWTAYEKRLQYQTYDVTNLLMAGNNAIGVTLASGWYRGTIGFSNNRNRYGTDIALLLQVDITYADGTTQQVVSDASWKSSTGPIRYSEIYNGETYDARLEKKGWELPGFDDAAWSPVKVAAYPYSNLVGTENELVTRHESFKPVKVFTTPAGEKVIDFGQNLVGWVIVKAKGKAGDSITLSHAEVLDKEGNFYTTNLRSAKAKNHYILKGTGVETFHPHFSWQGFRYIRVEGFPGTLDSTAFEAVALYSDMATTGSFSSSNPLINQLQKNIQWGQKGNFLDVPTDCPQRDERLGWTGDAQAFCRTASFNMNVNSFFTKWLKDVEADQINGRVPFVVPNVLGEGAANSAGWADVATIAPWTMFIAYGDTQVLRTQYNSMKSYVESIRKTARDDLWNSGFHFGDWLFYRPDDDNDGRAAVTDKYLIAQCFYAHSTDLLVKTAKILGNSADMATYTDLLQKIKAAFVREYLTTQGRLVSGTQTAYVLALNFDMLPEDLRAQAAKRLVENIASYDNHLTTGFLGTPYLCHVLTRFGYTDVAYKLLLQESYPSWLYPVKMGATTIWERWDGIKPDGSFQTPGMNSYNHYAYGAIGDWMYRIMVGLDTEEDGVGYQHSRIRPHPGANFTQAAASLDTYYGKLSCDWKITGNKFTMDVEIPANTTADVYIPAANAAAVTENGKALGNGDGITTGGFADGYVKVKLGSGKYSFAAAK